MALFSRYNKKGLGLAAILDNRTSLRSCPESEDRMLLNKKKIRREIQINGEKVWITADNEQDYANKLLKLSGVTHHEEAKHLFRDYADRWFYGVSKPNIVNVTANTYRRQLDHHINPVLGDMNLEEIDAFAVQQVFNRLSSDARQDTKNKIRIVLNQIFKMAVEEDLIRHNPMASSTLRVKGLAAVETEPYTVEEMRYFASHLNDIQDPYDRAWLALSVCFPLRPEEVLGLQWRDIDKTSGVIRIRNTITHPDRNRLFFRTYTKTAASRRALAIPEKLYEFLPEQGTDEEFVIGGKEPVSYTKLRCMRKRIAEQIGYNGTITPRRFRTTVATDISASTHDLKLVQHMLGHADPQMTLKHYDKGRQTAVDGASVIADCYGF